jgi:hypothetical protein
MAGRFDDPEHINPDAPAYSELVLIPTGAHQMLGRMLVPEASGPHPTLVMLHGIPGVELHLDLAHMALRVGYAVLVAHYRGAWGSSGSFGLANALEDCGAMIDFVHGQQARQRFGTGGSVLVAGHSLGAFFALMVAADHPAVAGAASFALIDLGMLAREVMTTEEEIELTVRSWDRASPALAGASGQGLVDELMSLKTEWDLSARAERLAPKSLLLVGGSDDRVAPIEQHQRPLIDRLRSAGAARLTERTVDVGHSFYGRRLQMAELLAEWLVEQRR